jgi:hypothetical protein
VKLEKETETKTEISCRELDLKIGRTKNEIEENNSFFSLLKFLKIKFFVFNTTETYREKPG